MNEDVRVGDVITILKKPNCWSAYFVNKDGRSEVTYPYTGTIEKLKHVKNIKDWGDHISAVIGGWGWDLDDCKYIVEKTYEIY